MLLKAAPNYRCAIRVSTMLYMCPTDTLCRYNKGPCSCMSYTNTSMMGCIIDCLSLREAEIQQCDVYAANPAGAVCSLSHLRLLQGLLRSVVVLACCIYSPMHAHLPSIDLSPKPPSQTPKHLRTSHQITMSDSSNGPKYVLDSLTECDPY